MKSLLAEPIMGFRIILIRRWRDVKSFLEIGTATRFFYSERWIFIVTAGLLIVTRQFWRKCSVRWNIALQEKHWFFFRGIYDVCYNIHWYCTRGYLYLKKWIFGNEYTYEAENNQIIWNFVIFLNVETDKKDTKLLKIFWLNICINLNVE